MLGDVYKEAVLELNASDERFVTTLLDPTGLSRALLTQESLSTRGIDVVRNRIKTFAQKKVTLPPGRHKIVILDEADSYALSDRIHYHYSNGLPTFLRMTTGAQQAMRRTMEVYSNTTRFALACNTSNKIIEPIQSRCAILRYSKLKDAEILKRLLEVCEMEKVLHFILSRMSSVASRLTWHRSSCLVFPFSG